MSSAPGAPALRIATRNSPLALWQADHVKRRLEALHPGLGISVIGFTTQGDRLLDSSLQRVGGKGLFVKELELALLEQRADLAVHSMKDVPAILPEGLKLDVICEREDPRDAFVSPRYRRLDRIPAGGVIGTSSLRRRCQLSARFPELRVADLRGNINTRLRRLDNGDFDGIVLAAAGLIRLGLVARIGELLPLEASLPAAGQGALGLQCRAADERVQQWIAPLHNAVSARCIRAERAVNEQLQGGCQLPIACHGAVESDGRLRLRAMVGSLDGRRILREELCGSHTDTPEALGQELAERLLRRGAAEILDALA